MTTLDDLVEDMARLTDAPCTLEDPGFRLLGFSDHRGEDVVDWIRERSILARTSSAEVRSWFLQQGIETATGPLRTAADDGLGIVARLCVPARHLDRVHGYFWLLDPDHHIPDATWPEAARIAASAAGLLSVAERQQAHRDALFRDLVERGRLGARESAADLADAAGLSPGEPITCLLVERPQLLEQVASRPRRSGLVWVRPGGDTVAVVVGARLLPTTAAGDDAARRDALLAALGLRRRLDALDQHTRIAVGPTVDGLDDLAAAYRGARVALRVAHTRPPGTVTDWADLGPVALLGVARDEDLWSALVPERVAAVLASGPADVVETARTFLDEAGSASRTAERLAVHRQTVYHRLAHLERATGLDLARGRDRLSLHLALELAPFLSPATP